VAERGDIAVGGGMGPVRGGNWAGRYIAVAVGAAAKDAEEMFDR
jgi:hypothetical protein